MSDHTADFVFHLPLSDDGPWVLPDLEVEIGFNFFPADGEVVITSVCMDAAHRTDPSKWARVVRPIDLLAAADPLVRALGEKIRAAAYADEGWIADALRRNGWEYSGKGGLDPDGKFRRVA